MKKQRNHYSADLKARVALEAIKGRAGLYYDPRPASAENLELMRLLDEQYTRTPFYGIRRMAAWLRAQGYAVNHKRVGRAGMRCRR